MSASYTFTTNQIVRLVFYFSLFISNDTRSQIGAAVLVSTGAVIGCILVMKGTDVCVKLSSSGATIWLSKSKMAGGPVVPTPPITSTAPIPPAAVQPPSHWQSTHWHSQPPPHHDYHSTSQRYGHDSWLKSGGGPMPRVSPNANLDRDPWGSWRRRTSPNAFWPHRPPAKYGQPPARSNRWQGIFIRGGNNSA